MVPAIQAETILYFVRKSRWVQNDVRKCFFSFLSRAQMDLKFENDGGPETLLTHQRRQNFFVFDFREIWIWYLTVGKLTLCILPKTFKMYFSANKWLFRRNIFGLNVMQFFLFSSNIIVCFYIMLKLRTPRTQNFLKYRNILSGSRDSR